MGNVIPWRVQPPPEPLADSVNNVSLTTLCAAIKDAVMAVDRPAAVALLDCALWSVEEVGGGPVNVHAKDAVRWLTR